MSETRTSPLQRIHSSLLSKKNIRLFIKRDDLIHPQVSGNKWRKLKYNLAAAKDQQQHTLLTFGGAFSNHIHAVAAAGKVYGFQTIGLIRGERIDPLNTTLAFAEAQGMQLHFISRSTYRQKNTKEFQEQLQEQFGDFYSLPEGGTNPLALKGCAEIIDELQKQLPSTPDYVATCCGTGGTIGGMIQGSYGTNIKILGIAALKGDFLTTEVKQLLAIANIKSTNNWSIFNDYHFGGYAKFKPPLIDFINNFKRTHGIALDPIYTGKLLYGLIDLIQQDYFEKGSTIVAVHTGGLQGIEGFNTRYGALII